jgi:uncharacterized membrane protein
MNTTVITNTISKAVKDFSLKKTERQNIDQGERFLSLIGGSYLLYKSLKNSIDHPLLAIQGLAASGLLIYRGATGICPVYERLGKDTTDPEAITITETIVVNAPREKVYAFWRELSNLPKFMEHLKRVTPIDETRSHWEANTPGHVIPLKWNAEITREEENAYLGWQSIEGSMIENAGKVEFKDTMNQIGTELYVEISYFPPAGSVGRGVASLFNGVFEKMIREDIQSFKQYAEQNDFLQYVGLTSEG